MTGLSSGLGHLDMAPTAAALLQLVIMFVAKNTCLSSALEVLERTSGIHEFCQTETFTAQCGEGEIIAMTHAMYGRMHVGRCVTTDYGHVGCQENVLLETDRRCSGRRTCQVRIPDAVFDAFRPCPMEFKTYFEAEYTCLGVATADPRVCSNSEEVTLTAPRGYLSNTITESTGVGSNSCPWKVTMAPGQRINITLIDFARPLKRSTSSHQQLPEQHSSACYQYALVTERKARTKTTRVCGGEDRIRHVYISKGNTVEIRIFRKTVRQTQEYFLIKYQAVGCALLENQEHGWIQYDEFGAIIGCNHSEDTWRVACRENTWYGMRGNCTAEAPSEKLGMVVWGQLSLPYGVSIGIIVGLAFIVGVIILLVGLICLEWKRMKPEGCEEVEEVQPQEAILQPVSQDGLIYIKHSDLVSHQVLRLSNPDRLVADQVTSEGPLDNDYAFVREAWPITTPTSSIIPAVEHCSLASADSVVTNHGDAEARVSSSLVSIPSYSGAAAALNPSTNVNAPNNCLKGNPVNAVATPRMELGDGHIYESPGSVSMKGSVRDPHFFQFEPEVIQRMDDRKQMAVDRVPRVATSMNGACSHAPLVCDTLPFPIP